MPTERPTPFRHWRQWGEGILLIGVSPFLLFPSKFFFITTIALFLVAILWLWPIFLLRSPLIPVTPYNLALTVLLAMVFVGILVSGELDLTLPKATGLILGISLWRYLIVFVNNRSFFDWATAGYIILGIGFSVVGILGANWFLKTPSQVKYVQGVLTDRTNPVYYFLGEQANIHPNQVAGAITLFLPLLISMLIGVRPICHRRQILFLISVVTLLTSIALILTQSRSGWVGVLGGIFSLLIFWGLVLPSSLKRKIIWISTIMMLLIALLILISIGPQTLQEFWLDPPQETVIGSLTTLNFRQELWPWAITAVTHFPLTGIGLGSFRRIAQYLYPIQTLPEFDIAHAHNVFLQITLDLGIPGLISYIAILLLSGVIAWRVATNDAMLRPVSLGLLASLIAFHIYGLVDTLALGSKPGLLLWGSLGLFGAMNQIMTQKVQKPHPNGMID